jgi:hypothetical protein
MQQDVTFLLGRLKELTDPSSDSPVAPLEKLVKDKPTPKKQMSATINGLLGRSNSNKETQESSKAGTETTSNADELVREAQRQASEDALTAIGGLETPEAVDGNKDQMPILETALEDAKVSSPGQGTTVITAEPDSVDDLLPAADPVIEKQALAAVDKEIDALLDDAVDGGVEPITVIEEATTVEDGAQGKELEEKGDNKPMGEDGEEEAILSADVSPS